VLLLSGAYVDESSADAILITDGYIVRGMVRHLWDRPDVSLNGQNYVFRIKNS